MPNIAKILKDEIQRLARHEIKVAVTSLRKDNIALKRTVADLKRRLTTLEAANKRQAKKSEAVPSADAEITDSKVKAARISGKMIRSIRARLGLSQDAFARLVGVSSQAVYQWEAKLGRLDLRGDSKARIVAIRLLGKREAKQRLADMQAGQ